MKKAIKSPANRRIVQGRGDVPLYSEDHKEGEEWEESTQPLEGAIRKLGCKI